MKKRYRVVIELDVEAKELTADRVASSYQERKAKFPPDLRVPISGPPDEAAIARQRMLLDELFRRPEALDEYLRYCVMLELTCGGIPPGYEPGLGEERFFGPLIDALPPKERHWFRQCVGRGTFVDENEDFFNSFETDVVGLTVSAVE